MSNLKIMMHRLFHGSCKKSQEKIVKTLDNMSSATGKKFCLNFFNDNMKYLGNVLCKHWCSVIAAHRARRSQQILALYRNLYGRKSATDMFKSMGGAWKQGSSKGKFFLLGATLFNWNENRVTDEKFKRVADDLSSFIDTQAQTKIKENPAKFKDEEGEEWEQLIDEEHFRLWRCPVAGSSLYKYKAFGTYSDVSARSFYRIQMDFEYRRNWDNHIIELKRVDTDKETGSEVIYWATHFPLYFLNNRDYLFVRRYTTDRTGNYMMLTAQAVEHPDYPVNPNFVRVARYDSNMLIKPHRSFDENGFNYVMSYYDEPQLYVPTYLINRMTLSNLPTFCHTLYLAAKKMQEESQSESTTETKTETNNKTQMEEPMSEPLKQPTRQTTSETKTETKTQIVDPISEALPQPARQSL